jgi:hypothetical protein
MLLNSYRDEGDKSLAIQEPRRRSASTINLQQIDGERGKVK